MLVAVRSPGRGRGGPSAASPVPASRIASLLYVPLHSGRTLLPCLSRAGAKRLGPRSGTSAVCYGMPVLLLIAAYSKVFPFSGLAYHRQTIWSRYLVDSIW